MPRIVPRPLSVARCPPSSARPREIGSVERAHLLTMTKDERAGASETTKTEERNSVDGSHQGVLRSAYVVYDHPMQSPSFFAIASPAATHSSALGSTTHTKAARALSLSS